MKLKKRLAAVLLSAVMILTGLTACGGTGSAGPALNWENSRTKKYLDTRGITAQEYTLTATVKSVSDNGTLRYAVKGQQVGLQANSESLITGGGSAGSSLGVTSGMNVRLDEAGNLYRYGSYNMPDGEYTGWMKYAANSDTVKEYAPIVRLCYGYFIFPQEDSLGSITAGEYKMNGKTYYTETLKMYSNNAYMTYTYAYDGDDLSFILAETSGGVMLSNIELKKTADQSVIGIPQSYKVSEEGTSGGGAADSVASSSAASSSAMAD